MGECLLEHSVVYEIYNIRQVNYGGGISKNTMCTVKCDCYDSSMNDVTELAEKLQTGCMFTKYMYILRNFNISQVYYDSTAGYYRAILKFNLYL